MLLEIDEFVGGSGDYVVPESSDASAINPIKLQDNDSTEDAVPDNDADDILSEYPDLSQSVFKTSNRLIDDIKADLLFLLDPENTEDSSSKGILKKRCIEYSQKLESTKYNPYGLYIPQDSISASLAVEKRRSRFHETKQVTIIRALLYNNNEPTLSRSKVFHVRLLLKTNAVPVDHGASKDEYHLINELNDEDELDFNQEVVSLDSDSDLVRSALPKIIDEATYYCSQTEKILRIEISEPEFDHEDLHDFEIGPINVRYNKALNIYPDLNPTIPSPAQCLHTLYKAIRGPLLLQPGDQQKTIQTKNKSLNSNINPAILLRKLQFQVEHEEFFPPLVTDTSQRDQAVIRESYIRKLLEVSLLGTKSYSATSHNPFSEFQFTTSLSMVFHHLGDSSSIKHHQTVKDVNYINISAYPFYSDDLIIECYNKTTTSDPVNAPIYFDNLKAISLMKSNYKLSSHVSKLVSLNFVGQKDIDDAYKSLNIDPEESQLISDDLLLTMYKTEAAAHPLDNKIRSSIKLLANQRNSALIQRYLKYEPLPLNQAYELLEIDATVDDDVVTTAVMIKRADSPEETALIDRALITIATERKSSELLNNIEMEFPDLNDPISFRDACEYLGIDENASEFQIISIYQSGKREVRSARNALRVIGNAKNSKVIESFLRTGIIDHNLLPAENWPVGLNNIGNTCYLNSLLQYYFSIKPFRDAVLNFYDTYNGEELYLNRRIGGRLVKEGEVERSFQFTYQLRDLFYEQIHSDGRCVTPSKELAYLAFLPSVAEVEFKKENEESIRESVTADLITVDSEADEAIHDLIDLSSNGVADDTVMVDGENLFQLDTNHDKSLNNENEKEGVSSHEKYHTSDLISSAEDLEPVRTNEGTLAKDVKPQVSCVALKIQETEMETAYEIGRQQDVTECIGNVLSQIEAAMKPDGFDERDKEQNDLVKRLFFGKTVQHLIDVNDPTINRDKTDRFSNLFVNISDKPRNLYEAFDYVFKSEEVNIDNGTFNRSERITELPIILQIQISRVYFDRVALRPYKSIDPLPFPETLYMDRYMDTDDTDLIQRRHDVEQWKAEITQAKERRAKLLTKTTHDVSYRDALADTKAWLEDSNLASSETIAVLDSQIKKIDQELLDIYYKINSLESKIDHHFDKYQKHGYSIFAIFIHRGEANYGHYWIYIKDKASNMYRKYNDEIVSEVTLNEVFNFEEKNTATPYFLGYIKNGHEDDINPLFRVLDDKLKQN